MPGEKSLSQTKIPSRRYFLANSIKAQSRPHGRRDGESLCSLTTVVQDLPRGWISAKFRPLFEEPVDAQFLMVSSVAIVTRFFKDTFSKLPEMLDSCPFIKLVT